MVTGFNTGEESEVLLVLLEPLSADATFYMTDRPWDGAEFLDSNNDGTLKWNFDKTLPQSGELCYRCTQDGSVVDRFENVTGNDNYTFSLASTGDTILLYCLTEPDANSNGTSSIRHISAITNTGGWITNASAADGGGSVLPSDLPNNTFTTLSGFPNFEYDGRQAGTVSQVRAGLSDAQNWDGHDEYIENLQTKASFKIVDDPNSGAFHTFGLRRWVAVFAFALGCTHWL